jgi:hypothetical protein
VRRPAAERLIWGRIVVDLEVRAEDCEDRAVGRMYEASGEEWGGILAELNRELVA